MTYKLAHGILAALLMTAVAVVSAPSVTLAKDTAATTAKKSAKSKKADTKAKKAKSDKKKAAPKAKAAKSSTAKKPAKSSAAKKPQAAAKPQSAKSPKRPKATSACQGLEKTACAAKNCIWVKASVSNGKQRKAYCRKRPSKK